METDKPLNNIEDNMCHPLQEGINPIRSMHGTPTNQLPLLGVATK